MQLPFLKMEGIGNDYIFFDALYGDFAFPGKEKTPEGRAQALHRWLRSEQVSSLSDRHTGIGGDGVVLIGPAESADAIAKMQMWNADGSKSAICGNALRCVALQVFKKTGLQEFVLESGAGRHTTKIKELNKDTFAIEVEMGEPIFAASRIPYLGAGDRQGPLLEHPIAITDSANKTREFSANILSMGNPHCVIFCEDADHIPLAKWGPAIEKDPHFPDRSNVEFVSKLSESSILYQRTWERGSGETLACGSGACAVAVAARLLGLGSEEQQIRLRGGDLWIRWQGIGKPVFMTGPARLVFTGTFAFAT